MMRGMAEMIGELFKALFIVAIAATVLAIWGVLK